MNWLEIFGWIGSGLVVASLMVANTIKFRTYNLIGCVIATSYNWILGIWPYMAMNAAITIIDAYWLWKLIREARSAQRSERATCAQPHDDDAAPRAVTSGSTRPGGPGD